MEFALLPVEKDELKEYKSIAQEAFQKGFEAKFGQTDTIILPEKDLDNALNQKGAIAYKAMIDGEMVGGAIIATDAATQCGHLDFFLSNTECKAAVPARPFGSRSKKSIRKSKNGKPIRPTLKNGIFTFTSTCADSISLRFIMKSTPCPTRRRIFTATAKKACFFLKKI